MDEIRVGQIWVRQTFSRDSNFYPRHSWRVRITDVNGNALSYKIIEYDGKPLNGDETVDLVNSFLTRFEKES